MSEPQYCEVCGHNYMGVDCPYCDESGLDFQPADNSLSHRIEEDSQRYLVNSQDEHDVDKTVPYPPISTPENKDTISPESSSDFDKTSIYIPGYEPVSGMAVSADSQGRGSKQQAVVPPVGWLVCIEGVNKGKDYKLRAAKNRIGREGPEVIISNDPEVSREHAILSYNYRENSFRIREGSGSNLLFLNGEEVEMSRKLKRYDKIMMGGTTLLFCPLCDDVFQWHAPEEKVSD